MMKSRTLFFSFFLTYLFSLSLANAATYYVATTGNDSNTGTQAAPFLTLSKGIQRAANGDTVLLANGTYSGTLNRNLNFGGKNFTLKSQGGAVNCIIDCDDASSISDKRGFAFTSGENANAVVDGFTIKNGSVLEAGGGIFITNNSAPTIKNCTISQNSVQGSALDAAYGGGVAIVNASATLINCTLTQNGVYNVDDLAGGGGIAVLSGAIALQNCVVSNNTAHCVNGISAGAGIQLYESTATLTDCTVESNAAVNIPDLRQYDTFVLGAGIHAVDCDAIVLTRCSFSLNALDNGTHPSDPGLSVAQGGGAYLLGCHVTGRQCRFSENFVVSVVEDGIAIRPQIAQGGGLYQNGGTSAFTDCTFNTNVVSVTGSAAGGFPPGQASAGGIMLLDAQSTLLRCDISANKAVSGYDIGVGGGLLVLESNANLTQCTVSDNEILSTVPVAGGGLGVVDGMLTMHLCTLSNNRAASFFGDNLGAGLGSLRSLTHVTNCLFLANFMAGNSGASGGGAGFTFSLAGSRVVNCAFVGNRAEIRAAGSALSFRDSSLSVTNCALVGNTSAMGSGGVIESANSSASITNSIFFNNSTSDGAPVIGSTGTAPTVTYSDVQGGYSGTGNINTNPLFVRIPSAGTDGNWGTADDDYGDLHLQSNSPCLNAGTASASALPPYDYAGYARNQGTAPDMGIYEAGGRFAFDLYVDNAMGSDSTGNGTPSAPYKTVARALNALTDPFGLAAIYIKAGNYGTDRPTITRPVILLNWGSVGDAIIGRQ